MLRFGGCFGLFQDVPTAILLRAEIRLGQFLAASALSMMSVQNSPRMQREALIDFFFIEPLVAQVEDKTMMAEGRSMTVTL